MSNMFYASIWVVYMFTR